MKREATDGKSAQGLLETHNEAYKDGFKHEGFLDLNNHIADARDLPELEAICWRCTYCLGSRAAGIRIWSMLAISQSILQ